MHNTQIADYFFVAGLEEKNIDRDVIASTQPKLPIVDLAIINKTLGEKVPKGFDCCELTPTNFPANLNHGSLIAPEMYLCFRRGNKKPPITDIGSEFYLYVYINI